ncbi:MAG: ATP-binding protein [Syntrophomonadaceae bacterium]|nr:ATP-binding protein [Syntrophomonadaceae bacterium]
MSNNVIKCLMGTVVDGSTKPLEICARYNPENRSIESNIIDVSEKVNREKRLYYQAHLLENIQESIIVVNSNDDIMYFNNKADQLLQLSKNNTISGKEIAKKLLAYSNGQANSLYEQIIKEISTGIPWQQEFDLLVDGHTRRFMHRVDPLKENGKLTAVVIISTDVTELVMAREKAEAANMAKSQFLANMSHEIRTPMIGILGAVELLGQSRLNLNQQDNVGIIRECGEQLLTIINEILDVSKIELGTIDLNMDTCNIKELFTRTVNIVEPTLKSKGLELQLEIDDNLPARIITDQLKLRQVMLNILSNAVKFTSQGKIHIKARPEKDSLNAKVGQEWLKISIADTGIGIPHDKLDKIFEPFTQADSSTSRQFGGTGLGLYICKKLIELMDGEIWLESSAGYGTTFYFKIPLEQDLEHDKPSYSTAETIIESENCFMLDFNPVNILVVEDNELSQKIIIQMLGNYGFEVTTVSNGQECLQILQERLFDIILMDMQMPVMDGYETTRLIRQDTKLKDVPIIAITANALSGDREKCLACGCNSYISKPFKTEKLVEELNNHINLTPNKYADTKAQHLIDELIPEFVSTLKGTINDLNNAITKRNLDDIRSISHDIKGTAGMYGFAEISQTAALIEDAARNNLFVEIAKLAHHLAYLFKQAQAQVS